MLGRTDQISFGSQFSQSDTALISELELTNLLTIATSKEFEGCLNKAYMEKLKVIVKTVAEEKIDRTIAQIEADKSDKNGRSR